MREREGGEVGKSKKKEKTHVRDGETKGERESLARERQETETE